MRGRIFLALFVVSGMLVSCDFQQEYGQEAQISSYDDVDVVLNASVEDDFNGILDYLWAEGKVMHLRLSGSSYGSLEDCEELVAVKEDGKIKFQGVLPSYREDDNFFLYYASDISFSQDDSLGFVKTVASEQSGRLKDVVKHALYYSWIRNDYAVKGYSDGSLNLKTQLAPMFALLKINIPEQLQVKNLKIETEAPVTGQMHIHPQRGWGRTGEGCFLYRPEDEMTTFIKVSQGDDVAVDGDLYMVIVPDAYDETLDCYYSSMDSFVLSCSSSEGPIRYRYTVDDIVRNGSVVDLGQLAVRDKKDVNVGQICLTSDVSPTVAIKNPYPDFEFYYELGDSEGTCATPTVNSQRFDLTAGFRPTITGAFDRYFIKILAHSFYTDCKDVVMTASFRNWKFGEDSSVRSILEELDNGATMTEKTKYETSDGIEVYVNKNKKSDFEEDQKARLTYTTAYIQLNAALEYDSDAWISFIVDRNISVSYKKNVQETENTDGTIKNDVNENGLLDEEPYNWPNQRGYRLFYNNSEDTRDYWTETVKANLDSMTQDGKLPSEKYNMCLNLSDLFDKKGKSIKAGDKFGLRGDGKHVYYGMALLEVL